MCRGIFHDSFEQVNLRDRDFVNFETAHTATKLHKFRKTGMCPVIDHFCGLLVVDIDKGGVFAQVNS